MRTQGFLWSRFRVHIQIHSRLCWCLVPWDRVSKCYVETSLEFHGSNTPFFPCESISCYFLWEIWRHSWALNIDDLPSVRHGYSYSSNSNCLQGKVGNQEWIGWWKILLISNLCGFGNLNRKGSLDLQLSWLNELNKIELKQKVFIVNN